MLKRQKKSVSLGLRKEWLRRAQSGESAPHIANADGYDVRTVRKHLELAKQESEIQEARHVVLRQALEKHYEDLCAVADKLDSKLLAEFDHITPDSPAYFSSLEFRKFQALRQHLPKSPMWKEIDQWNNLVTRLETLMAGLRTFIIEKAEEKLEMKLRNSEGKLTQLEGFIDSMVFHLRALAEGWKGLEGAPYVAKQFEYGRTQIQRGAFSWVMPEDKAVDIQKVSNDLDAEGIEWKEYEELRKCLRRLQQLRETIRDELAIVTLRRVVPGRCVYCPL